MSFVFIWYSSWECFRPGWRNILIKSENATGDWRNLRNEDLHNLRSFQICIWRWSILRLKGQDKISSIGHEICKEKVWIPQGTWTFGSCSLILKDNIKTDMKKTVSETELNWLRTGPSYWEQCNEASGFKVAG